MTFHLAHDTADTSAVRAIRGRVVTLTADPFVVGDAAALIDHPDGLVVVESGLITAVGAYADLAPQLPEGTVVDDHRGKIISAGFIDTHVHYVQTGIIGAF